MARATSQVIARTEANTASRGGGMYNFQSSNSMVANCTFSGNLATTQGGGMFNHDSSPTVMNCTFSNTAFANGGGMANVFSNPQLSGCVFEDNAAGYRGGGMANDNLCDPILIGSTFYNNVAVSDGGAISNWNYCDPVLLRCVLADNTADYGGAVFAKDGSMVELTTTRISGNAAILGGGMFGELALIDDLPRMATATAFADTVCLAVPKEVLQKSLDQTSPVLVAVLRMCVRNIRSLNRHRRRGDREPGAR